MHNHNEAGFRSEFLSVADLVGGCIYFACRFLVAAYFTAKQDKSDENYGVSLVNLFIVST